MRRVEKLVPSPAVQPDEHDTPAGLRGRLRAMRSNNQSTVPGFPPIPPATGSRAHEALKLLAMRGLRGLTTPEVLVVGNGWRLAASVKELQDLGWQIRAMRVPTSGARRRITRYFLASGSAGYALTLMKRGGV